MADDTEPSTLADHLGHLAADADDVVAMLTRTHDDDGDVRAAALGKSERVATSLKAIISALGEHEHLAAGPDDVWAMLTRRHTERDDGTVS